MEHRRPAGAIEFGQPIPLGAIGSRNRQDLRSDLWLSVRPFLPTEIAAGGAGMTKDTLVMVLPST
jgi:hypothetical protein